MFRSGDTVRYISYQFIVHTTRRASSLYYEPPPPFFLLITKANPETPSYLSVSLYPSKSPAPVSYTSTAPRPWPPPISSSRIFFLASGLRVLQPLAPLPPPAVGGADEAEGPEQHAEDAEEGTKELPGDPERGAAPGRDELEELFHLVVVLLAPDEEASPRLVVVVVVVIVIVAVDAVVGGVAIAVAIVVVGSGGGRVAPWLVVPVDGQLGELHYRYQLHVRLPEIERDEPQRERLADG